MQPMLSRRLNSCRDRHKTQVVQGRWAATGEESPSFPLARVGRPPTPTRAGRLADASVDPTEARKATVRRFGRSDRSAQRIGLGPALSSCRSRAEIHWVINGSGMP
jgi:hypothetical protein